jgi:DNA-directed RNA polymerase specialized sigma24 family protein
VLRHRRQSGDFEDLVAEAVISAWKSSERRPDLPLKLVVTCAARWQEREWYRSARCGDIVARDRSGLIRVFTTPWTKDGERELDVAETEADFATPDFADALIEALVAPPVAEEDEGPHFSAYEKKKQREEWARQEREATYARAREKDRRFGEEMLEHGDLLSHYREAVRLHFIEGWSMSRVGKHLGLPPVSIHEAIRNSRRRQEKSDELPSVSGRTSRPAGV